MTPDARDPGTLDAIWASPANSPATKRTHAMMEALMKRIEDENKHVNRITTIVSIVLLLFTGRILYDAIAAPGVFDVEREWATVALLILPWIALIAVRLRLSRKDGAHTDPGATLSDMLRRARNDNAIAQWRVRFLGAALALGAAFTGAALFQLIETGKMTERNALQGAILFGGVLAFVFATMVWHYVRVLRPEARRLEQLTADGDD